MRVEALQQTAPDDAEAANDDEDDRGVPPGAAASWTDVKDDGNVEEEQTTSKSTDVIVVTSPVCSLFQWTLCYVRVSSRPIKVTENADKKQEESSNTKRIQQCTLYILM